MPKQHYAHSLSGRPPSDWQPLQLHLANVARNAGESAALFDSSDWARAVGWLHDLGKYSNEFQDYLQGANDMDACIESLRGRVDHSTAGAQYAAHNLAILGHLLAYAVAGHHSGLLNGRDTATCQESRLEKLCLSVSRELKYCQRSRHSNLRHSCGMPWGHKTHFPWHSLFEWYFPAWLTQIFWIPRCS